jgi:hypothetical protein
LDANELAQYLEQLSTGDSIDARETIISGSLLDLLGEATTAFGILNFQDVDFTDVESIGPLAAEEIVLDGAKFARPVRIEVHASTVSCVGTQFNGGLVLRVSDAVIVATDATFGPRSSISTSLAFPGREGASPRLVSLRGVDVSNLVLVDVDLSDCLFVGAHRLDQLRLEDRCRFASPPTGWRFARRQMLFEEFLARGWAAKHDHLSDALTIRWERIAALYRSLRKAFEDGKNEAGAGDFYYGEMEARRHSEITPPAERWILAAYWALSGYGQRAVRAVTAIAALVVLVAVSLFTVGLPGNHVWSWTRVDQSLRIALGAVVFRDAGQTLTSAGAWTVMIARFVGPVLLALGVLAVRARVKR